MNWKILTIVVLFFIVIGLFFTYSGVSQDSTITNAYNYGACPNGQGATAITTTTLNCGAFLTTQTSQFFSYGACPNSPQQYATAITTTTLNCGQVNYNQIAGTVSANYTKIQGFPNACGNAQDAIQNFSYGVGTTLSCYAPLLAITILNPIGGGSAGVSVTSVTYTGESLFVYNVTGYTDAKLSIYDNNKCAVRLFDLTSNAAFITNNNTVASNRVLTPAVAIPSTMSDVLTNWRLDVALTSGQASPCNLQTVILILYNA